MTKRIISVLITLLLCFNGFTQTELLKNKYFSNDLLVNPAQALDNIEWNTKARLAYNFYSWNQSATQFTYRNGILKTQASFLFFDNQEHFELDLALPEAPRISSYHSAPTYYVHTNLLPYIGISYNNEFGLDQNIGITYLYQTKDNAYYYHKHPSKSDYKHFTDVAIQFSAKRIWKNPYFFAQISHNVLGNLRTFEHSFIIDKLFIHGALHKDLNYRFDFGLEYQRVNKFSIGQWFLTDGNWNTTIRSLFNPINLASSKRNTIIINSGASVQYTINQLKRVNINLYLQLRSSKPHFPFSEKKFK